MAFSLILRLVALCLLPLVMCEPVWTEDKYQTLTNEWDRCNFPPNDTRTDDILGICTRNISSSTPEDEALLGIIYLCSLFEKFSSYICENGKDYEISDTSKSIIKSWSAEDGRFYRLCDVEAGFRIIDNVMKVLGNKMCTLACSAHNAEKLCQLIVIFSLTDYKHMEKAAKDLELTTTTETQTTVNDSVATTSSTTNEGSKTHPTVTSNEMITISTETPTETAKLKQTETPIETAKIKQTETPTEIAKIKQTETSTETAKIKQTETSTEATKIKPTETPTETTKIKPTDKPTTAPVPTESVEVTDRISNKVLQITVPYAPGYVTSGQLAIYGISFFLLCAIVFATYKYRHSILSCLRESQTAGPPGQDGKGGYRKIPNFERVLPNMEDREKAKSFIY